MARNNVFLLIVFMVVETPFREKKMTTSKPTTGQCYYNRLIPANPFHHASDSPEAILP